MSTPQQFCHSCGMPTEGQYCEYCSDENGNLKSHDEVREGIAYWLSSWAPSPNADFRSRADSYMRAMPAWAEQ